jgi:transposase
MNTKIKVIHEQVDDIPVLMAMLLKLRVAELIDKHFPTNGNRTGVSLGQMLVIWLTFILSQADHRLNQVEPWVENHQITISQCLSCKVEPRDCTDDRLATGLDYLSVLDNWQFFEAELNGSILRCYDLKAKTVRVDTTTACAYVTPEGLFQFGHSKDHRPDLPQLKISMSTLDPLGLPLTTTVLAGQSSDSPLYLPEIAKARHSIGHCGVTYIGDCKMAALKTRATIMAHSDYYLCPLSQPQMPTAELDSLLKGVLANQQALRDIYPQSTFAKNTTTELPDLDERIAVGFELTVKVNGSDSSGKIQTWNERRLVIRSLSFARSQTQSLNQRLQHAQAEIAKLNLHTQGKPRFNSSQQLQSTAQQIADSYNLGELLHIDVQSNSHQLTKRAYAGRPATKVEQESFCVQTTIDQAALELTFYRLGWRVYVTNQSADELPLEKAVYAYRDQYLIEQGFGRFKGVPLSLTPLFLQFQHRILGLILLLSIALRVLVLTQFVVRKKLKQQGQKLSGIYAGQPGRHTSSPTTEMLLRSFRGLTLSCITIAGHTHWHLTPLSVTQTLILKLLGLSMETFSILVLPIPKTNFHSREP